MPLYRVVSRSAGPVLGSMSASRVDAALSGPNGVVHATIPDHVALGDLVDASGALVARNTSTLPLDQQDWWRLHRVGRNLSERHRIERAIRAFFDAEGFLDVTTPAMARSPGLEVHLAAFPVKDRFLITSPEYHMKRLLSAGWDRLVFHGRAFRDDEAGRHHHGEFTMLEWYRAFAEPSDIMTDIQKLVAIATGRERTWTTLPVRTAVARYAGLSPLEDDPERLLRALVEYVEPAIAELGAVFLTEWPRALASLARLNADDPAVSDRFEAYLDGVELANGFGELTDAREQRTRLENDQAERHAAGLPVYPIDEAFLGALEAGLPRSTGVALGLDRLIMIALGASSLDDVVAFPPALA
jgi:lysyl-tRNA synthetase class 2